MYNERVHAILEEATGQDINSWEKGFLKNVLNTRALSPKQEAIVARIETRLGIGLGNNKGDKNPEVDKFGFDVIK